PAIFDPGGGEGGLEAVWRGDAGKPAYLHLDGGGMGVSSGIAVHARHRDGPDRHDDRRKAQAERQGGRGVDGSRLGLIAALALALSAVMAAAETLRIATYNVGLGRAGPGLL